MEAALKIAYQYCQLKGHRNKKRFLKLKEGYHGDTLGAVSVGGIDLFHETYRPLLFDTLTAPAPYCYRCQDRENCREECLAEMVSLVEQHRDELVAVVLEPVMQGAGGMIPQPPGYLARVREVTRQHGVLLICDEVATGFGRTGSMFACGSEDVSPDLLCLAKGITGGLSAPVRHPGHRGNLPGFLRRVPGIQGLFPRPHLHRQPPGRGGGAGQPGGL